MRTAVPAPSAGPLTVPRWARIAAHATTWVTLPSGLWRIALVLGVPVMAIAPPAHQKPGIVLLSVLSELAALLTLGLVQSWGEVLPRWLPLVGGRRVPVLAATTAAGLGALTLMILWPVAFLQTTGNGFFTHFTGTVQIAVMIICYAPLLAWGPLLAAVTVHYYRRRTRHPRSTEHFPPAGRPPAGADQPIGGCTGSTARRR